MGYVIIQNGELPQGYFVTDTCNKPRIGLTIEENGQTKTSYIPLCTTTTVQHRMYSQYSYSGTAYNPTVNYLGLDGIQTYYTYYPMNYNQSMVIPKNILDLYAFKTSVLSYTSSTSFTEVMTKSSFEITAVTHSASNGPGYDIDDLYNIANTVYNAGTYSTINNAGTNIANWSNNPAIPLISYSNYINVTRFTHNENITTCTYTSVLPYGFPLASLNALSYGIEFTITTLTGYIIDMETHNLVNSTTQKISSSYRYKHMYYSDTQFMTHTSSLTLTNQVRLYNESTPVSVTRTIIGTSNKGNTIYQCASYYSTGSYTFANTNNTISHRINRYFVCPLGIKDIRGSTYSTMFERYTTTTWI